MAIVLNGTSSNVTSASFGAARPSAYSVSLWCKVDATASLTVGGVIAEIGNTLGYGSDAGDLHVIYGNTTVGFRNRAMLHTTGITYTGTNTAGSTTKDVWRQFVSTYAATRLKYFENGTQIGATANLTVTAAQPADWIVTLGRNIANNEFLKCKQCHIGYWDVELSADEVAALGKGFSPRQIRPQSLKLFVPGLRDTNAVVGVIETSSNITYDDDNPRIYA